MMNEIAFILNVQKIAKIEKKQVKNSQYCGICCHQYQLSAFYSFGCDHFFCQKCLISAVKSSVTDFTEPRCCQEGCQKIIDQSQNSVYHLLSDKTKKKVDLLLDNFDRIHNIRICKSCNKGTLIESINTHNKQILKCGQCQTLSCYNCFSLAHQGKCTNVEILDYPSNCGQCRKCKSIIEKIIGCSHVKCICGYQFCFQCSYHWEPSHICQFKLQKRTGYSKWCCNFIKAIFGIPLAVVLLLFFVFCVLLICLLSSLFFGALGWLNLLERRLKQVNSVDHIDHQVNNKSHFNCLLFLLWMLLWPLATIVCVIFGFFIPFLNLCYKQTIVFSPTVLAEFWSTIRGWIDFYLIL